MNIEKLQTALNSTPYKGVVKKVFSSKFGNAYDVGLAHLESGKEIVIKIKDNPRSKKFANTYTREAEYKNLQALGQLNSPLIPRALYYKAGVLLMTLIEGQPLRMVDQDSLNPETFKITGQILREINDLDTADLDYLIRFDSFRDFLQHEFELLFTERLQLDLLPLTFYEEFREKMLNLVNDEYPADIALIAKDAYGAENMMVHDGKLSGLIDFEDLMIAPRILQLRPPIDAEYLPHYIEGYGKNVYERNYFQPHLDMLKAISSLRGLYLAHEQNADDWKKECISKFDRLMSGLECDLRIPA